MNNLVYPMDLVKLCRLCFSEKTDLHSLRKNTIVPDLCSKIKDCVAIEVRTNIFINSYRSQIIFYTFHLKSI